MTQSWCFRRGREEACFLYFTFIWLYPLYWNLGFSSGNTAIIPEQQGQLSEPCILKGPPPVAPFPVGAEECAI